MSFHSPLVSIIILNHDGVALTLQLLKSLKEHSSHVHLELIIVDNDSAEDPGPACRMIFPQLLVIYSQTNKGYAAGMNLGMQKASGDYFFLLNNDIVFSSDVIGPMIKVFADDIGTGMVSPKIMQFHNPELIEYAGYTRIDPLTGRNKAIGFGQADQGQFDTLTATPYAHGAALMVSRQAYDAVGPMPEEYFLYYEEMDWSERCSRAGYKIYYQPAAVLYHIGSATTGKKSILKTYYLARNRIRFMKYNRSDLQYGIFLCFLLSVSLPVTSIKFLWLGMRKELKAYWEGVSDGLSGGSQTPERLIERMVGKR